MPISFSCENCGRRYSVGDELAGKAGKCKACGQRFTVPQPARSSEPAPATEPEPGPPTATARGRGWWIGAGLAAVLGVLGIVVVPALRPRAVSDAAKVIG